MNNDNNNCCSEKNNAAAEYDAKGCRISIPEVDERLHQQQRKCSPSSFITNMSRLAHAPWSKWSSRKDRLTIHKNRKPNRLLREETVPPDEMLITSNGDKTMISSRRRRIFQVFHWKFMLLSVLFVFGLCGTTVMWFTTIYNEQILNTLTLGNGTKIHMAWKNPPLEPLVCVHIFNYTNTEEFLSSENKENKSVKLKVQDVGPYCYREKIERLFIQFRNNETEMSYREKREHSFDADASVGSLNDTVYVPNILILSVYDKIPELGPFSRYLAYSTLSSSSAQIFSRVTVGDFLTGYQDDVFILIGTLRSMFSGPQNTPTKFGALAKRVGLSNDTVVVKTGIGNLDEMGQVVEINNITQFNAWGSKTCNQVDGSDGLFFRRSLVQSQKDIALFHKDSCRSLPLEYNSPQQLRGGINAYRYKLKSNIFDSRVEENACFYNSTSSKTYGILPISSCSAVSGAPVALSRPHFLDSNVNLDAEGSEVIEGLNPALEKHDFHIDVFPILGLTIRTLMRMQMNIIVNNPDMQVNAFNPLGNKTVLPMFWVEMNSGPDVPEKMYSLLYHLSYTMRWAELALKWTFLFFTLFIAFVLFNMSFSQTSKKELLIISRINKKANNVVSSIYVPSVPVSSN